MPKTEVIPELRQILGALIFGAGRPLPLNDMRKCLREVAEASDTAELAAFGELKPRDIQEALASLREELERTKPGFFLAEVAGGFVFQSDPSCGGWLKQLLNAGKPNRLSQPALETLAIVAYRQPLTRADIEAVRGVNVDHMVKQLMELQLVKITGRSELPGKPFLYGTTQAFLEHFGLKSLKDLDDIEPMLRSGRPKPGATPEYEEPVLALDDAGTSSESAAKGKKKGRRNAAEAEGEGTPAADAAAGAEGGDAAAPGVENGGTTADDGWSADTGHERVGADDDERDESVESGVDAPAAETPEIPATADAADAATADGDGNEDEGEEREA